MCLGTQRFWEMATVMMFMFLRWHGFVLFAIDVILNLFPWVSLLVSLFCGSVCERSMAYEQVNTHCDTQQYLQEQFQGFLVTEEYSEDMSCWLPDVNPVVFLSVERLYQEELKLVEFYLGLN